VVDVDAQRGVAEFLALLTVERGEEIDGGAVFRPSAYPDTGTISFVYGGQLLAQSIQAAAGTVGNDRLPHSVHAHFLRAGTPNRPYGLAVTTVRDGGSFSHRRVEVGHDGDEPFFVATVSFTRPRTEGAGGRQLAEYQLPMPAGAGEPDTVQPRGERPTASPWEAFDIREFPVPEPDDQGLRAYSRRLWLRLHEGFPVDDPVLSAGALAFASDFGLIVAASVTEGTAHAIELSTSLDHALWLHRPTDVHAWHLLDMVSVSNSGARSVVRASFHRQDGDLVASAAQEVLIR
jgi:acyl-CoA thioesterase-2